MRNYEEFRAGSLVGRLKFSPMHHVNAIVVGTIEFSELEVQDINDSLSGIISKNPVSCKTNDQGLGE